MRLARLLVSSVLVTCALAIDKGLHNEVYLSKPSVQTLFSQTNTKWATVTKSNFEIPSSEAKLMEKTLEATSNRQKQVETLLKTGNFKETTEGQLVTKQKKMLFTAALEKCYWLNGKFLEIKTQKALDQAKTLLGTATVLWQSHLQTPVATYFLVSGDPLPNTINTTSIQSQNTPLTNCETFNTETNAFGATNCLTKHHSICVSNYPTNLLSILDRSFKFGTSQNKDITGYFENLQKTFGKLPLATPTSPTDIDSILSVPWATDMNSLTGDTEKYSDIADLAFKPSPEPPIKLTKSVTMCI